MKINLLLFVILYCLANIESLDSQSSIRKGKDYAYFFYVSKFKDRNWPNLPETKFEVEKMAEELRSNYGFQVEIIPNPSRQAIIDKIRVINRKQYGPNDQILYFFSTHGDFNANTDRGFLIPYDGNINDTYGDTWLSYDKLGNDITASSCKHILLALDACYSGAFGDRWKYKPTGTPDETQDCTTKLNNALANSSRLYVTSGSRNQRTPAKSKFAKRFLETLYQGHELGMIRIEDLRYYLNRIEFPSPEGGSFTNIHKGGDFVFVHKNACGTSADTDLYEEHWQSIGDPPDLNKVADHLKLYPGSPYTDEALAILLQGREEPKKEIPDNMVFIKGGTFEMGSEDGEDDEKPIHTVKLSDYYLSKYEITNSEFALFLNEFGNPTIGGTEIYEIESSYAQIEKVNGRFQPKLGMEQHPVVEVSWYGAVGYCNWRSETDGLTPAYTINGDQVTANWQANGYRLPTEAEWEFAARSRGGDDKWAGTSTESQLHKFGNYSGEKDGYAKTAPIGNYESNGIGLHDMSGNVWEWCWDWYGDYSSTAQTNPHGSTSGSYRVIRGGSWGYRPAYLRCADRDSSTPDGRRFFIGFRLSRAVR